MGRGFVPLDGHTKAVRGAVGVDVRRPTERGEPADEVCAALRGRAVGVVFLRDGEQCDRSFCFTNFCKCDIMRTVIFCCFVWRAWTKKVIKEEILKLGIKDILKQNGCTTAMYGGSIKAAEKMLLPDETVISALTSIVAELPSGHQIHPNTHIKDKESGVVVLTNKRLFFVQSILGQCHSKEILLTDIQSIDQKNVIDIMMSSVLRIQGITISFEMDGKKKQLSAFAEKINKERIQSTGARVNSTNSSVGALDDLEKLADFLDKGIITVEEFEAKKKQILGL